MFLISAVKNTPIGLKVVNFVSWLVIGTSEMISESINFLDPEVAQSISLYCAALLSIITAIITIRKELKNAKKDK